MEPLLNPPILANPWFGLLVDVALKATVVLLAMGLFTLLVRRASAAGRHLAWSLSLYGLLAMPLLYLAVPAWHIPLLPGPDPGAPSEVTSTADNPSVDRPATEIQSPAAMQIIPPKRQASQVIPDAHAAHGASTGAAAPAPAPAAAAPVSTPDPLPWTSWVLIIWAVGAILTLTPLMVGLIALWQLARQAQRITDRPWLALVSDLGRELGLNRQVRLLRCFRGTMPMTWGLVRPVVLLPADADDWPAEQRRLVLLHELAHVQRRDCLTQLLAQLACAMYWFHPLVWLAARQLRRERERACDDQVLRAGSRASDYALLLLETARSLRAGRCRSLATVAMAQRSQLEGRLLAVLDPKRPRQPLTRRRVSLALVAAAALVVPLAGLRPWASAQDKSPPPQPTRPQARADKLITVSGQVLTPDGKPAPGAEVALLTIPKRWWLRGIERDMRFELLGQAQADTSGRFRFKVPRLEVPAGPLPVLPGQMIASGKGFGFGLQALKLNADSKDLTIKLTREQIVRGRLVDLQGAGIKGISVQSFAVIEMRGNQPVGVVRPAQKLAFWPGTLVTNAEGRFVVRGLGRGQQMALTVDDDRYAPQMLEMGSDPKADPREVTRALPPSQLIEGRVTCEDTGKPLANAQVMTPNARARTDKDGRYRLNPFVERYAQANMTVLPPDGEPYLGISQWVAKAKVGEKRKVDVAMPRGILVRGRVTEAGSGRPLGKAVVYFIGPQGVLAKPPRRLLALGSAHPVTTADDGTFRIAVPSGKGRLLAKGYSPDYIPVEIGTNELYANQSGGGRWYAHAVVPLDLKPKAEPPEMAIKLRRGITIKGTVVGPDGKPAAGVRMLTRLSTSAPLMDEQAQPLDLAGASFELKGCDPEKAYPVVFLDEKNRRAALVPISGKQTGKPLTIRLEPCGSAVVRFVDEGGQPRGGYRPEVDLLLVPGRHRYEFQKIQQRRLLAADSASLRQVHQRYYQWTKDTADAQGRYPLPMLVPGVTYRIWRYGNGAEVLRDFQVKAGAKVDLGDIKVK